MENRKERRRGLKTKVNIRDEIIRLKKEKPWISAAETRTELVANHPGAKAIPKERAIYKIWERNKEKIVPSVLDKPWSLGSNYNDLPIEGLKQVISIQKKMLQHDRFLTNRRARWIAILSVLLAPIDDLDLLQIASFYTRLEQLSEINDIPLDTRDLDATFLINRDMLKASIIQKWVEVYYPQINEDTKRTKRLESITKPLKLNMSDKKRAVFNKFADFLMQSVTDESKRDDLMSFVIEHPEIQEQAVEWLALNTRRDIMGLLAGKKDGEK